MSVGEGGPPALVVEVLSESNWDADLDAVRGKPYSYARAGVNEYLVLDLRGHYTGTGVTAWRQADGAYRTWEPCRTAAGTASNSPWLSPSKGPWPPCTSATAGAC